MIVINDLDVFDKIENIKPTLTTLSNSISLVI
jgi:hypothetical protein